MATIDEKNFRKSAKDAVKKYGEIGRVVDALYWAHIIGLYETELARAKKAKK